MLITPSRRSIAVCRDFILCVSTGYHQAVRSPSEVTWRLHNTRHHNEETGVILQSAGSLVAARDDKYAELVGW